jgi:thymidylate kinase
MTSESVLGQSATSEDEPLELTRRLFAALEEGHVRYSHWKSTTSLARALAGRTDLDLLVDRQHATRFDEVARDLGFKPFLSHESRRFPGVEDLLGYDDPSGRLVHLHLYYQLVLGQQYLKNHRLPLEQALLTQSILRDGVRVPPPELEVAILALRTLLKYRDQDAVKDGLRLGHRGGIPAETLAELRDLAGQSESGNIHEAMRRHLPDVPSSIVTDLIDAVEGDPRDAVRLVAVRRAARIALRPYERLPRLEAAMTYGKARLSRQWPLSLVTRVLTRREQRRKSPRSGGTTVAVIGVDGAGKSTVVRALREWLAWRVNITVLYMGSAQPSRTTRVIKAVAKGSRSAARRTGGRPEVLGRLAQYLLAVRHLADARDREARALEGRRLASRGVLVIFDRYALPGVRLEGRPMDGPRIRQLMAFDSSAVLRRLARREELIYRRIPAPDHIVVLHISGEEALQRKANPDPASVMMKARAIDEMDRSTTNVVDVDATQPIESVVRDVKRALWSLM